MDKCQAEDIDDEDVDTDTKVALLASILEPTSFPVEIYLEALAKFHGDVGAAAESLLLPTSRASGPSKGKRKAETSIHSWLTHQSTKGKRKVVDEESRTNVVASAQTTATDQLHDTTGSAPTSPSKTKPPVDLFTILRQPFSTSPTKTKGKNKAQPALLLTSQTAIDTHSLPLTLLNSPLSSAMASALYLTMMNESESWEPNRFYLAGKWVESPHTTTVYKFPQGGYGGDGARYFYSGTELSEPKDYPPILQQAAKVVEDAVNTSLAKRKRYPLEWSGKWRANVCGANRYDGASSGVGWHADQLTYLGPYTTIASLSLGTPRAFRVRQTDTIEPDNTTKPIRTYEVNLGHNSLVLMNGGCQERYKHTVPSQKALDLFRPAYDLHQNVIPISDQKPYTSRINITFRFYRDDFHPIPGTGPNGPRQGTPMCKCGIPTLLRADQKAKARTRLAPNSPSKSRPRADDASVQEDDMVFFWQCQSPGQTGDMKGCGFFRILDMRAEGRGPCLCDR